MARSALSRLVIGFGVLGAAIATRCFATVDGGVMMTFGSRVPAMTRLDLITGPVALFGIAVLAAGRNLAWPRRLLGLVVLVAAVAWPALKLGDMGEVLLVITDRHGVHSHDLVVVPMMAAALGLLTPWRSPLRLVAPAPVAATRALRPVTQR